MSFTYEYARPALTVDAVVFGLDLEGNALKVLLIKRGLEPFKGTWALPGGFVQMDETIEAAVARELHEETGIGQVLLDQFHTFGAVHRDPRERVVSVAHFGLVKLTEHEVQADTDADAVDWFGIHDLPTLAFDHTAIIGRAVDRLRDQIRRQPGGFDDIPNRLSFAQTQVLYEMVLRREIALSQKQRAQGEQGLGADGWIESVRGQLGQYHLEQKLGEGGMGEVYRAKHTMLRRPTAIKLLSPERAGEQALVRFEKEVQLTAGLSHPNTVTVFDYGRTDSGVFYYAMELIDGATVQQIVGLTGPQEAARVIQILQQALGALGEAHALGLIHRDVKPANLMLRRPQLGSGETVKVLDFGLVKDVDNPGGVEITHANMLLGTPHYMAPEAFASPDNVDGRSDLYALAAVGYYMLTGTHVFAGTEVGELAVQHLGVDPEPPTARLGRTVAADLEQVIMACLHKNRARRPADAHTLQGMLADCADANRWSPHDSIEWWEEHGPALAEPNP